MTTKRRSSTAADGLGTVLNDRYQLVRLLGDGGMGAVYKAADLVLRRFVAIKMLHTSALERRNAVARFEREARASAAIGHPNIVDVLDFGRADGRPFLVMEYLRGQPLSRLIAQGGPLSVERACRIATHTLTGLAVAHAHNIIHRDLKPANLMLVSHLGEHDFVKICDFGFAAMLIPDEPLGERERSLTPARTLVGTPAYAAPERLRGKGSRFPTADIYSVGVVLYEMLSGRRPFEAAAFAKLSRMVVREVPKHLLELRPNLPPKLAEAVHRALAKSPEDRWSSAEEFAADLVPFGGRFVPVEDPPSDTFSIDLQTIQARQTNRLQALREEDAEAILSNESLSGDAPTREKKPPAPPKAPASPPTMAPAPRTSESAPKTSTVTREEEQGNAPSTDGSMIIPTLRFVANRFGERALTAVLDELDQQSRLDFDDGISAGSSVRLASLVDLIATVDRVLGNDDLHLVVQCGRAMAEGAANIARTAVPEEGPVTHLLKRLPSFSRRLFRGPHLSASRIGDGFGRLELIDEDGPSLVLHVAMLGLLERYLEEFGGHEVEVTMLSSRALGDARTLYEISWL